VGTNVGTKNKGVPPIEAETPYLLGTGGRTRTGKILQSGDFESPASTIPPHRPVLLT
jgi:hypothetical protein